MADKKISQLTALSAANVAPATDVLAIVDTSATETKKITAKDLIDGALNGGTANGVLFLNASKVATSGSALVFDGTNLGLGVTPSAGGATANYKLFEIGSGGGGSIYAGVGQTLLCTNVAWSGGTAQYKASSLAPLMYSQETGTHIWKYAAAGTAGNNISFTQAMTLDASGNLVVGNIGASGVATATPIFASLGNTFASTTGDAAKTKLRVFQDNVANIYGFGVSSGILEYHVPSAAIHAWYTNNTERARITDGGYLLVGDTTHTDGSIFTGTGVTPLNAYRKSTTAAQGIFGCYSDTGGTKTVRAYFQVDGGLANYSANNVNLSDQRVKDNINPAESYWNKIKALEIVTFRYKDQDENDQNIGVIAQQVENVAPEFVSNDGFGETPEGEEPLKTVYTTDMYHAAIKALQEAMARIESLEAKVAALESK